MINKHYLDCLTPTYMYKLKSVLIQILSRSFETYKLWWALEYSHLDPIWMIWHTHKTGRSSECPHTDPIWMIWHTYYRMSPIISSLISYLKNLTQTYLDELDDVFILQMFLLVILQEFPKLPLPQTAVLIGLHPCTVSNYTGHCQGITDLPSLLVVFGQVISTISGYYT